MAIVAREAADAVLVAMHAHPLGRSAQCIGHVSCRPALLCADDYGSFGGRRVVDWLSGEPLPRIC